MLSVNLDAANTLVSLTGGGIAIASAVLLGVRRMIRNQLTGQLAAIQQNTRQLEHNGGSHVADYARDARDSANSIARQVADLAELVDDAAQAARTAAQTASAVNIRLDDHLASHSNRPPRWRLVRGS